jgi:hypothetical membrane protein
MKLRPFSVAVAYFVAVIIVAHFFSQFNYDWTQNTISDLGAQGHVYNWIMRAGFIGFGLILTFGVVRYLSQPATRQYFLLFIAGYGLSVLVTGIFCTAPIDPSLLYSARQASLHSLFATLAGISMTLGLLLQVMRPTNPRQCWTRLVFLLLVVGISALFGMAENNILALGKGVVQRTLYLSGLAWLVYEEQLIVRQKDSRQEVTL